MLWYFLIVGCFIMVAWSLILARGSLPMQMLSTSIVAIVTTFALYLIYEFKHPFAGDVRVTPVAFERVEASFDRRLTDDGIQPETVPVEGDSTDG